MTRKRRPSALPSSAAVDHLVYATPSLDDGVARIRDLLGVEPSVGGRHPRWGTRNALVGLGSTTYLEVIGPDPDADPPDSPRPFSIDDRPDPGLAAWAVRISPLEAGIRSLQSAGFDLGRVMEGSRELADGTLLRWQLTDPGAVPPGGTLPFLIDWRGSPHPGRSLRHSLALRRLRIRHPEPAVLRSFLLPLAPPVIVEGGDRAGIAAVLEGPEGSVELT